MLHNQLGCSKRVCFQEKEHRAWSDQPRFVVTSSPRKPLKDSKLGPLRTLWSLLHCEDFPRLQSIIASRSLAACWSVSRCPRLTPQAVPSTRLSCRLRAQERTESCHSDASASVFWSVHAMTLQLPWAVLMRGSAIDLNYALDPGSHLTHQSLFEPNW